MVCEEQPLLTKAKGARHVLPDGDGKKPRKKGKTQNGSVTPHQRKREVSLNSIQFIIFNIFSNLSGILVLLKKSC